LPHQAGVRRRGRDAAQLSLSIDERAAPPGKLQLIFRSVPLPVGIVAAARVLCFGRPRRWEAAGRHLLNFDFDQSPARVGFAFFNTKRSGGRVREGPMRARTERDQCQAKLDILIEGFMGDDWNAYREAVAWLRDFTDQKNIERGRVMWGGGWHTPQTIAMRQRARLQRLRPRSKS
jgi:hypothetical protein